MSALAPTLQAFFTERLMQQLQASPHTVAAYRDTFRLLLAFVERRTGKAPSALEFEHLDVSMIVAFLDHIQHERRNSARSRNSRLAAIHSLFRFAALRHPELAGLIARVLAIPSKRFEQTDVSFLNRDEIQALLAAPDPTRWLGRRDHALLAVAVQTGLRVSELTGLRCGDVELRSGAHVRCTGKGRKARCTPLSAQNVTILNAWLHERKGQASDPLFPTSRGRALSRDAVGLLVAKYVGVARAHCPSLQNKAVSPHTLRHTAAMSLLHAGVEPTVIALWLGHEQSRTTEVYVHADLTLKERALSRTTPPNVPSGRYRPSDALVAFLESL
jgi:site-specific recombinase XerD